MTVRYNQFAGRSVERLAALSDGLFAFAMTLLMLDLHLPELSTIHSEADLWRALLDMGPRLLMWLMSFMTLGIFWHGQQAQFHHFDHADRNVSWIQLGFLAVVSLVPFSTRLLDEFIAYRLAMAVYWANIAALGAFIYWSWGYATRAGLVKEDTPPEVNPAMIRRIAIAQALYAFGALLCFFDTYVSIGFILLVQLNYVFAPRLPKWLAH